MRDRIDDHDEAGLTFIEILGGRAGAARGDGLAFRFATADGNGPVDSISYAVLDLRARAIAARLAALGLAGERALLVYPPGLEFVSAFFGCLYAGAIAVPAHPPRPNRPATRLGAIAADARPGVVLTSARLLPESARWSAGVQGLEALDRLATDTIEDDLAADWRRSRRQPATTWRSSSTPPARPRRPRESWSATRTSSRTRPRFAPASARPPRAAGCSGCRSSMTWA